MPFESEAQRRYMYTKHPGIAARWSKEYPNQDIKDLPEHKSVSGNWKRKKKNGK